MGAPERPLALRMELLVASLAHAHQLPLSRLRVPDAQGQVRPVAQVLDVVDNPRGPLSPPLFAALTLALVKAEHIRPQGEPLRPGVKLGPLPRRDECPELGQASD